MEDILELFAEIIWALIDHHKFKRQSTRTRVITAFWLILGGILVGIIAWNFWDVFENRTSVTACICWSIAAAAAVGWLVFVIRGHLKNWPRKRRDP